MSTRIVSCSESCNPGKIKYIVKFQSEEPPEEFEIDDKYELSKAIWFPVCAGTDKTSGELVAIKKIKNVAASKNQGKRVFRELQFLREYRHPFIMKLNDVMVPSDKNNFDEIYIVTERMQRSLFNFIADTSHYNIKNKINSFHIKLIMNQLFRGLQYMHASGVIHRDIKPDNVLMTGMRVKLCDFGHTRQIADRMTRYIGTLCYSPPEYFYNIEQEFCEYGESVDIWALGCLFSDLLHPGQNFLVDIDGSSGQECINLHKIAKIVPVPARIEELHSFIKDLSMLLFDADNLPHTPDEPLREKYHDVEDKSAIDLLEKMLVFNPKKKITIEEALKHEYMADITVDVLAKELNLESSEVEQLTNWSAHNCAVNDVASTQLEEHKGKLYDLCLSFQT